MILTNNPLQCFFGEESDIDQWMELVRLVRNNFPGLETEESLEEHRQTVLKFFGKHQALCVKEGNRIAGVLLFSDCRRTAVFQESQYDLLPGCPS